jgi:beta-N-acetylhexosaminidase
MTKTLRQLVGQMLIVGVEGTSLSALERVWLKLLQPGGIILFRRNIESADQTWRLLQSASERSSSMGFRCVDVEGGLVDRLRDVIAPMPSAADVFATGSTKLWRRHGELIGREIRALGFHTPLAPVLDLALPASASVMRTRVTSPDSTCVIVYASEFLAGLQQSECFGCGKHFPGLGAGTLDSHKATPQISRNWEALWQGDLLPYRRLARSLPMIMVSHAAYPAAAKDGLPASISKFWIGEVLRKKIGFKGLVLSDDMEMGGILTQMSIEEAAVSAVLAGTDLIEICSDASLIMRTYEALLSEAERSASFRSLVAASSRRITLAKKRYVPAEMPAPGAKTVERLQEQTRRFAEQVDAARDRGSE